MYKPTVVCFLLSVVFCTCKSSEDIAPSSQNTSSGWGPGSGASSMLVYLVSKAPHLKLFTLDATIGGTISNDSVDVNIPPGIFVDPAGNPCSGNIHLRLLTIRSISDMMYGGITNVSSDGELVISDGMIYLEAVDDSNHMLKIAPGSSYSVTFPLYEGSNTFFGGTRRSVSNQVLWDAWHSPSVQKYNDSSLVTGIDSLFKFCSLGRRMDGASMADITVFVPPGFTNVNTECFLRYSDARAAAYLPSNPDLKAFSTRGAYYKVIAGRSVKLICCASKNNKFYYQVKTIAAIADDQTVTMDNMVEISEVNLQSVIAAF